MNFLANVLGFSFFEGLVLGLVAIGVYFTLRVLALPDLTVDGSYLYSVESKYTSTT